MSLAAINVTGPLAGELLGRLGLAEPPRFLRPRPRLDRRVSTVTSCACRSPARRRSSCTTRSIARSSCGVRSWRRGATSASGRTACRRCSGFAWRRATSSSAWTPSSTRRRGGSAWTGRRAWTSPRSSAGRPSSGRAKLPDDRRWVGFSMEGPAPVEGTPIFDAEGREIIGNVTGSWHSPLLGKARDARLAAAAAAPGPRRHRWS